MHGIVHLVCVRFPTEGAGAAGQQFGIVLPAKICYRFETKLEGIRI